MVAYILDFRRMAVTCQCKNARYVTLLYVLVSPIITTVVELTFLEGRVPQACQGICDA